MNITLEYSSNTVIAHGVRDFASEHIFDCGQCFRWNRESDGSYSGIAFGRGINVSTEGEKLIIKGSTIDDFENIWKKYFDLERDYGEIKETLKKEDPIMEAATHFGEGIRILNQDEWETLISFILSQNRNIPLIKRSVEELCRKFGREITDWRGERAYAFPEIEAIACLSEEDLVPIKLGYRASYVIKTARAAAKDPQRLYEMIGEDIKTAADYLQSFVGVGPKVANCILLFSMEKYDSFPIDVWVKRLMSVFYGCDENKPKEIAALAEEKFGRLGGFAQQYLFYYARENLQTGAANNKNK